jgi:hypothetical protein
MKYNICPKDGYYEKSGKEFRQSIAYTPFIL